MSRSAEAFGRAGARGFLRCTPAQPCPVCGRKKFCSLGEHGVLCTRVADGATSTRETVVGVVHFHPYDGARVERPAPQAHASTSARASAATLDVAYRALLGELALDAGDRDALIARGLDGDAITRGQYCTLHERGRSRLAGAIIDAVGVDLAPAVPGIVWREADGRGWWSVAGWPGLVVPARDLDGRIVGLKVRRSGECQPHERYTWVSSTSRGGPGPGTPLHVPAAAMPMLRRPAALWITEGELKADVSTHLGRVPVVGIPGVGAWAVALDAVRRASPDSVVIALDSDARTNPAVARAQRDLVAACSTLAPTRLARWDAAHKGLDDYLLAMRGA